MTGDEQTYSRSEVVSGGFEARCIARDGTLYFWHRTYGIKINRRMGTASLLTDPSVLPDEKWTPTRLGLAEIAQAASRSSAPADAAA